MAHTNSPTAVCGHFPYSPQELHAIIKVRGIHSFGELLVMVGHGEGCAACKAVIASVLAQAWGVHALKDDRALLQAANDRFLANLQKDGTYSVVPRIPGGEITPVRLIALGKIARKYRLYVKITGGQRIDLLGARLDQLPKIWQELIDAGFESGQSYGKSVRTVKSCVGSAWCRYGVQDAVGLAIELENRYKGLRAPHKVKMAVSGCTRECAEAQSKDVGVIATEKGWNLYVCGNGGMKPRHAELLATDVDTATLIRYIDRFLMFYIRCADRLQRTSTWRMGLEGGLDYLKQVVIEDKLGFGMELEAEMAYFIATYRCEWKAMLEDVEKTKRFCAAANDPGAGGDIVMVHPQAHSAQLQAGAATALTVGVTRQG